MLEHLNKVYFYSDPNYTTNYTTNYTNYTEKGIATLSHSYFVIFLKESSDLVVFLTIKPVR